MAIDSASPRSRRTMLAAAAGAGAALAAGTLGRPQPVRAANGDPVTVGGSYSGTAATSFSVSTEQPALVAYSMATTGTSDGLRGEGYSPDGIGVSGIARATSGFATGVRGDTFSPSGTGVLGVGGSVGVSGFTNASYGRGVEGYAYSSVESSTVGVSGSSGNISGAGIAGKNSSDGTGVFGQSGYTAIAYPARTGVFGYADQSSTSRGVHGRTTGGRGVYGEATTGYGVRGYATTGTAVYAGSADAMKGYALRAVGRVRLDNCAGVATIAAGSKSKTVTPGIDLTSASAVVATLQGSAGGTTTVHRVTVNPTANSFTIYLTANSTANVKVAWHVFG